MMRTPSSGPGMLLPHLRQGLAIGGQHLGTRLAALVEGIRPFLGNLRRNLLHRRLLGRREGFEGRTFGMDLGHVGFDGLVGRLAGMPRRRLARSEEHTSELQSLMRISYAVFCLKKKTNK